MKRTSDLLKDVSPAVSMVTRQAGNEELHRTDFAVVGEVRGNGAELTPHNKAELSQMGIDHEIGTQHATRGDRDTDQECHVIDRLYRRPIRLTNCWN